MATLREKLAAEQKVRELLERDRVPLPDRIEYGSDCIRLYWNRAKVVLVVDIDEVGVPPRDEVLDIDAFPRET